LVRQSPERLVAGGARDAFPFRSPLAAPMPCMKITRGRGVAEQVARARRVARSKHDGATSGKRAACFGLSLKTGKKRVASAFRRRPRRREPRGDRGRAPRLPRASLVSRVRRHAPGPRARGARGEHQAHVRGLCQRVCERGEKRVFFSVSVLVFFSKRSRRSNKRFRRARNTGTASRAALPRRCTRHPGCGT